MLLVGFQGRSRLLLLDIKFVVLLLDVVVDVGEAHIKIRDHLFLLADVLLQGLCLTVHPIILILVL